MFAVETSWPVNSSGQDGDLHWMWCGCNCELRRGGRTIIRVSENIHDQLWVNDERTYPMTLVCSTLSPAFLIVLTCLPLSLSLPASLPSCLPPPPPLAPLKFFARKFIFKCLKSQKLWSQKIQWLYSVIVVVMYFHKYFFNSKHFSTKVP